MKKYSILFVILLFVGIMAITASASDAVYTVRKGDSLWSIARQIDTTVEKLVALNPGIDANNLEVGTRLTTTQVFSKIHHVVQPGDNLQSIAMQYSVPVKAIEAENKITNGKVVTGQTIAIPVPDPTTSVPYRWQEGDSFAKLAERYNTSEARLQILNYNREEKDIKVGSMIFVPAKEVHIVKSGETVAKVAKKFDINVDELKAWNNLKDNNLVIGQKLIVEM